MNEAVSLTIMNKSKIAYMAKLKIPYGLLNQKEDAITIYVLFFEDFTP